MSVGGGVIRGRDAELAMLLRMLDGVERAGGALVLRGPAGIGKSVLLDAATQEAAARNMVVLKSSGVQSEAPIPFAGLHQLLQPLLDHMAELPAPLRTALESAFGIVETRAPTQFLIALATLELLGDAAGRSPLLLVVDDAQWLDRPTAEALAFVARRLEVDPAVLLIAVRDGFDDHLAAAGLREAHLGPLDADVSGALVDDRAPGLPAWVRARLLDDAAGNPLALVELPTAIEPKLGVSGLLPEHLPLTERLERAFAARLAELPREAQLLLLCAAADGSSVLDEALAVASAACEDAVEVEALELAIAVGLVVVDGFQVRFRHPLVRSASYQTAALADRLAVHGAFADLLAGEADRAVWHRAASTLGLNEDVAAALEATAARARHRGAVVVAINALERAAELSADPMSRGRRNLLASELAFELGRPDLAAPLLAKAESLELGVVEQGRMARIRELVSQRPFGAARCRKLVEMARRVHEESDDGLALDILWLAGSRCWWQDPGAAARDEIIDALEGLACGQDVRVTSILGYAAPAERAATVIERLSRAASDGDHDPDRAFMHGTAAIVTGAWDLAPGFLATAVAGLRAQGRLGDLPRVLVLQSLIATYMTDWGVAVPAVEEAQRLGEEVRQPVWLATADAIAARIAAIRGDAEEAFALADRAEQVAAPLGSSLVLAAVQIARGATALSAGQPRDALDALIRLFDDDDPAGHWTVRWWAVTDLVEAARNADDLAAIAPIIDQLERLCERTPAFWLQAGLRHARALIGDDADADACYQEALGADLSRWPFERARLLLSRGQWLRRKRRVVDSRVPLRAARETFDAIGAPGWADRARQELRASGETSRTRAPDSRDRLTAQELQIAQMAATGLTNREIGRQLYLSHRTVGFHLHRVFPKLGVTSRGQLAAALAQETAAST
jgi:DNA-binding CsgD family transcriptional regulator/tetratricopeptide (TPR) repeat protein